MHKNVPRERLCSATHLGSVRLSVILSPEDWVLDPCWKLMYPGKLDLLFSELPELIKGGCVGRGISWVLLIILTTTDIDGLNSADACAQSNPIWSSLHASSEEKLPSRIGSTISGNLFDPYRLQTLYKRRTQKQSSTNEKCQNFKLWEY